MSKIMCYTSMAIGRVPEIAGASVGDDARDAFYDLRVASNRRFTAIAQDIYGRTFLSLMTDSLHFRHLKHPAYGLSPADHASFVGVPLTVEQSSS